MESIPERVVHRLSAAVGGSGLPDLRRYELIRKVGEGGMAAVYRGIDRQLGRQVAVKILHSFGDIHPDLRTRFAREAQIGARLNHPNVAAVHDAGEENGRLFIVMELVEGPSLQRLLSTRPEDRPTLVRLLEKAARGVHAAHELGVIHRDLKPANILVSPEGEPKVADFGLARLDASGTTLTRPGTVAGTPGYMAPEQIRGDLRLIGPATDVYALGVILYQVLTGRLPFTGDTPDELYHRILDEDPRAPGADPRLDLIALKAMRKIPSERYASAEAFADDLRRHLDDEPIVARPDGLALRTRRWIGRRRPMLAAAVAAAAVAVAVAGAAWLKLGAMDRERREREAGIEVSRRIEERLRAAETAIHGVRFFFYNKDADVPARLAELERAVLVLEELIQMPAGRSVAEAWGLRGVGRYLLGDSRIAETSLLEAHRLGWPSGEGPYYLGKIYIERAMMAQAGLGEPRTEVHAREESWTRRAVEWLDRPIAPWNRQQELERDVVEIYALLAKGREEPVQERCRQGLARHGEPWGAEEYWNLIGFTTRNLKARREAFDAALRIRPHYAWGLLMRGIAASAAEDHAQALADFDRALALQPRFAGILTCRAETRRIVRDLEAAARDAETAVALDPSEALGYFIRAKVRHDLGDLSGARADCDEVIRRTPGSSGAFWIRSRLSHKEGKLAEAIADLDNVIRLKPRWVEPLVRRAQARRTSGDSPGALEDLDRALRLSPRELAAVIERARLRSESKRPAEALEDWDLAVELAPKDPMLRLSRATVRDQLGDRSGAIEDLERALEIAPPDWPHRRAVRDEIQRVKRAR